MPRIRSKTRNALATIFIVCSSAVTAGPISDTAFILLGDRSTQNRNAFFLYKDADSGFNHGFASGYFGRLKDQLVVDAGCVDDAASASGCSTDKSRLDRLRGTVLSVRFPPLPAGDYVGLNIEEPQGWGAGAPGRGYALAGVTSLVFDARAASPNGMRVQFGTGGCSSAFMQIPNAWATITMPLMPVCTGASDGVNVLFTIVTNADNAPQGGSVLLDNIRFEPVPSEQFVRESLPLSTQTFGVVPLAQATGRAQFPPDQVLRNASTIYESALTVLALLARGAAQDLALARSIGDAFLYALDHDNRGIPLPVSSSGARGLHNAYEAGDLALYNAQGPAPAAQTGEVRLAGFSAGSCGASKYCLVLDGASGGNNAFAVLALLKIHQVTGDPRYLEGARVIATWISEQLEDRTGTGFGGYYIGYPDKGEVPKTLQRGKSTENNADIFAAFTWLSRQVSDPAEATKWTRQARTAGDFVVSMFDSATGCFHAGSVPVGEPAGAGITLSGVQRGNDAVNTFGFLDSSSFAVLALSGSSAYRAALDWRRPVQCVSSRFGQSVVAAGATYTGYSITAQPSAGPDGIAWEFTAQVPVMMRSVDQLYGQSSYEPAAASITAHVAAAQRGAPFGDNKGLVAATLAGGDLLAPIDQCLSTPFQCIPQRVGLAATVWAIFADLNFNPLSTAPDPTIECLFNWAERSYPTVLAPAGAATQYYAPFAYRYFSATDAYVGVSAVDRRVYYMGPDRLLQDLGALSVWVSMAACR